MADSVLNRPFAGPDDLQGMIELVRQRPADQITDFPSIIDLQEMLGVAEIQAHTRLWIGELGRVAGFAILDDSTLIFETAPDQDGCAAEMIHWAEIQLSRTSDDYEMLYASSGESDARRRSLLDQHGFTRQTDCSIHMSRSLDEPIPAPRLPDGFTIRPIAGEAEVETHVQLHRAAWGTEFMTVEYRLSMMHTPTYDPALDLVVVAPDGSLAAYCMCYINDDENALSGRKDGYTDPLATHPDHQRRGLAQALLLHGMALLKQRGMAYARLGTSGDNVAMRRAAEGVGFRVDRRTLHYAKQV